MAPPGRWGIRGSSLLAFGEKRRKAEVSTPLMSNLKVSMMSNLRQSKASMHSIVLLLRDMGKILSLQ